MLFMHTYSLSAGLRHTHPHSFSVFIPGHEERGEIGGEEDGSPESGPSQRPVGV